MSETSTAVPLWVIDPKPNGMLHRCYYSGDGPAIAGCGTFLPPRLMYREKPSVIPVCRTCAERVTDQI